MHKLATLLISLFLITVPHASAQGRDAGKVTSFHSDITINNDTSITINEKVVFHTEIPKHGIFRYIPTRYSRSGLNYTVGISDIEITDDVGNPYQFTRSRENGNLVLKIGDPDTTFTGTKNYLISYKISDALKRFDTHDELYWDITGEGWQIPVATSSATIRSPHAPITDATCYSGTVGNNDQKCRLYLQGENTVTVYYPEPIYYNDNLTVAIKLDQENSNISFPSTSEKIIKTIKDNTAMAPLLLPLLIFALLWYARGRDFVFLSPNAFHTDPNGPKKKKGLFEKLNIPMVYEPIQGLTPGEAGTILDEKTDNQDVVAEILDLARKKYLKIERLEKKKSLFGTKPDNYQFTKLKDSDDSLPYHQQRLLKSLFQLGDKVDLESLKGSFYNTFESVKDNIYHSLTEKNLFAQDPVRTRKIYIILAMVASGFIFALAMNLIETRELFISLPIAALSIAGSLLFAYNMPVKTAVGTNFHLQVKGLKDTIKRGAWREKIKEKHLFIEEILPFAVTLGVVDQLARDMQKYNISPPSYLSGPALTTSNFSRSLSSFSTAAASSLSYNPSSSSWSSGSGFSGGGSGGGGGGGGGGSW